MKIREIDNRLEMIAAEKRQLQRERREALRQTKVNWQPTADVIRQRQELAVEAARAGALAYGAGTVDAGIQGESLQVALSGRWRKKTK